MLDQMSKRRTFNPELIAAAGLMQLLFTYIVATAVAPGTMA
jgi:hypothetical protein